MKATVIAAALGLCAVSARAQTQTLQAAVLDESGKPIPDAVVYSVDGASAPAGGEAIMDQVGLEFAPHVLAVPVGTRVRFPNKDQVHHQLYSFSKAKRFELPLYKGQEAAPVLMDRPGVVRLGCNIHDWMRGYIVVVPNAAFGLTDASGKASLPRPASGELTVWSERLLGAAPKAPLPSGNSIVLRIKARGPIKPAAHHPLADY